MPPGPGPELVRYNKTIPLRTRARIFEISVLASLFNLAQCIPSEEPGRSLSDGYSRIARKLLIPHVKGDQLFHVPLTFVHLITGCWKLELRATRARLSLLSSLICKGPWAVLQEDGQWTQVIRDYLRRLAEDQPARLAGMVTCHQGQPCPLKQMLRKEHADDGAYKALCDSLEAGDDNRTVPELQERIRVGLAAQPLYCVEEEAILARLCDDARTLQEDGAFSETYNNVLAALADAEITLRCELTPDVHRDRCMDTFREFDRVLAELDWKSLVEDCQRECGTRDQALITLTTGWEAEAPVESGAWESSAARHQPIRIVPEKELGGTQKSESHWDQFKANAELFGYVSTFKEDLSQYSTIIDVAKVPAHARKKAERLAREIEVRHSIRGSADEEAAGRDEESLFSAVSMGYAGAQEDASTNRGRSSSQIQVEDKPREEHGLLANAQPEAQMKVSGSFFHVEGVGLLDENLVRSNPWMLDQNSARNLPMASVTPGFLSTQPQNASTPPADSGPSASPVLSTAPVSTPHVSFARVPQVPQVLPAGAAVMIDGLMTCPTFNGLSVIIDSYDAETNRYNVQLPLTDGTRAVVHAVPFEPNVMHGGSASSSNGSVPVEAERSPEQLLTSARLAADSERLRQALEFCTEGLDLLWGELCLCPVLAEPCAASRASSSSLAPVPAAVWRPGGSDKVFVPDEAVNTLSGLLCLRASAHAQLQQYVEALSDADELTGIQPTSADGYYWQSVALQGMGREHEALEALMSALEYEPQNSFYQQLLTALFEDISDRDTLKRRPGRRVSSRAEEPGTEASAGRVVPRTRGTGPRDALSTTTQATHLSSRSTTPTEVSEVPSRSSSNDSLYVDSAALEENAQHPCDQLNSPNAAAIWLTAPIKYQTLTLQAFYCA
eukprot:s905_g14.t1